MSKFLSCTSMTGGYGGEDIIKNCNIEVDKVDNLDSASITHAKFNIPS